LKISFRATHESILDTITKSGSIVFTDEKNLYIVNSDSTKTKITDTIFVDDEYELLNMTKYINKIYIAKNSWKMYAWDGTNIQLLSGGGGANSNGIETVRESITVVDGQTLIRTPFSYPLGGKLKVYKNGVLLDLNVDYTEVDSLHILVNEPALSTDLFTFIIEVSGIIKLEPVTYQLDLTYYPDGNVHTETFTGGVNKVVTYNYNEFGNTIEKIVERNNGVVGTATYEYDTDDINQKLIRVNDAETQIAVFNNGVEVIKGVKPFSYELELVYNSGGYIEQEIYTGDINKTITYTYGDRWNMMEKSVEEDGFITKATYQYDDEDNLIRVIDEGTEMVIVEEPIPDEFTNQGYDDTELRQRIQAVEDKIEAQILQEKVVGQLQGSVTLKDDILLISEIINDIITNEEETRFATDIGNGTSTTFNIVHNMGTRDVMVQVMDNSTYSNVYPDVLRPDVDTIRISFAVPPTVNQYRVLILG
jgi:hypothetical protein